MNEVAHETFSEDACVEVEYISFRVNGNDYCVDIANIREIRRWATATMIPHSPDHILGVINLRGAVVPVVDFSIRLGLSKTEITDRHSVIILEYEGKTIGILVDEVSDIIDSTGGSVTPTPSDISEEERGVIDMLIVIDERIVRIVNVENIIKLHQ